MFQVLNNHRVINHDALISFYAYRSKGMRVNLPTAQKVCLSLKKVKPKSSVILRKAWYVPFKNGFGTCFLLLLPSLKLSLRLQILRAYCYNDSTKISCQGKWPQQRIELSVIGQITLST